MTRPPRPADETIAALRGVGIIPVVRCESADLAVKVGEVLMDVGLTVIEITMTVPKALDAITTLSARTNALIGAGTVVDAPMAKRAVEAGAEFIVSPGLSPEVIKAARSAKVAVLPGAMTPTEVLAASQAGADLIKIFPVQAVGGPSYIRALRGPFPNLPLVPTGGVDLDSVGEFFRAGATAIGVGSELVSRDILARKDWAALSVRAEQFLSAAATARGVTRPAAPART